MANRRLILLANAFPYGSWEPFLETEIQYYEGFDEIHIFSLSVRPEQNETRREIGRSDVSVHPIRFRAQWWYALNAVRVLFDKNFYRELVELAKKRTFSLSRLVTLFIFLSRAHVEAREIRSILRGLRHSDNDSTVIYSYRSAYQPYLAQLIERSFHGGVVHVARGHRADLYEEHSPRGYLPMRESTLRSLRVFVAIAQDGKKYLEETVPALSGRTTVSFLGTFDHGFGPIPREGKPLQVLTCSNVVPIKRLDRVVEALANLSDLEVHWTHYGDGPELPKLKAAVKERLGPLTTVSFMGAVGNAELLRSFEQKPFDVIVNVSASEGIPVSIMEAFSFGVPAIATDVGGVREIVDHNINGILLPSPYKPEDLTAALRRLSGLSPEARRALRVAAREKWEANFDANTNYSQFANLLSDICD